jgi:hypothetical protein
VVEDRFAEPHSFLSDLPEDAVIVYSWGFHHAVYPLLDFLGGIVVLVPYLDFGHPLKDQVLSLKGEATPVGVIPQLSKLLRCDVSSGKMTVRAYVDYAFLFARKDKDLGIRLYLRRSPVCPIFSLSHK